MAFIVFCFLRSFGVFFIADYEVVRGFGDYGVVSFSWMMFFDCYRWVSGRGVWGLFFV